jgi:hypothetical protein
MSILHLVRCEQYENCKQEFSFGTNTIASDFTPETWIALFEGNPRVSEGYNFCSKACLALWILNNWHLNVGVVAPLPEPQEPAACKARRFLLVDESANITEGVKWANGQVSLDGSSQHCLDFHCQGNFRDWDEFKAAHDGSGVQWIDHEMKQEAAEKEPVEFTRWNGEPLDGWGER